ncbi:MAG: nickel-dependent hydrogenase large subunit [Ancalomicrobiaceae bacterium]|nr:nickel-dependent hydrogenase large subunit [Ancalomicrobiaceae bacterium]
MSATLAPGDLSIRVAVEASRVVSVEIRPSRPVSLVSRFAGRPVEAVAIAMARINAVCGRSHGLGVRLAAMAALRQSPDRAFLASALAGLASERAGEHLKSLMLAAGNHLELADPDLVALRAGFAAARALEQAAATADLARLRPLFAALPPAVAAAGRLIASPLPEAGALAVPDVLSQTDDTAVIAGLVADPGFARVPALSGRRPETGPPARAGISAADGLGAAHARLTEIVAAVAVLDATLGGADLPAIAPWFDFAPLAPGEGFAAIETPRGRLHYWLRVADGLVMAARAVAPTEWNFHPAGPFAAALAGAAVGADPAADIARRAAAFDPCVAVRIEIVAADA